MQEKDHPDHLREIFETDTSLSSCDRAQLMKRAATPLTDTGRQKEANKAQWDAALFRHHRRRFAEESKGRFAFTLDLSVGRVVPDPKICTEDVLDYFEQRAIETSNPVLKSWYADFIWERRRDHVFARMAIQALHETYPLHIEGGDRWQDAADSVVRPLRLARALRVPELVNVAKSKALEALRDFMAAAVHPAVRWTLETIGAVLEGRDVTEEETAVLLQTAEQGEQFYSAAANYRLARLFAEQVVTLLRRSDAGDGARDAELRLGQYFESEAERADSNSAAAMHLQDAMQHYANVGSREDVTRLKMELNERWTAVQGELQTMKEEFDFPKSDVQEWARKLIALGVDHALMSLACAPSLIPVIESVEDRSRKQAEQFPLQHLFTQVTLDGSRQVHRGDSPEKSDEAQLFDQYAFDVLFLSLRLDVTFGVFRDEGGLDVDALSEVLQGSPFIDGGAVEILEVGLERYLSGDYVSAMHVLIPQLEDVLRATLRRLGGSTTSIRDGVTRESDLGQVLSANELGELLGEDMIFYLRYLLVEQLGMNLRNSVAHGLIRKSECTGQVAALVLLSLFRLVPYKADPETPTERVNPS